MSEEIIAPPTMVRWLVVIIFVVIAVLTLFWRIAVYRIHLDHLPSGLSTWRVLYVSEKTFGLGPGGNETGILVYPLSDDRADRITKAGQGYLKSEGGIYDGHGGLIGPWLATPVSQDKNWPKAKNPHGEGYYSPIKSYMRRSGFDIGVDREVLDMTNRCLTSPGGYYSHSSGVTIVCPAENRVVFAYGH